MKCAFNRSGSTRAVVLHMSKVFDRVWQASLLKRSLMEFQASYLALFHFFSVIDGFK